MDKEDFIKQRKEKAEKRKKEREKKRKLEYATMTEEQIVIYYILRMNILERTGQKVKES